MTLDRRFHTVLFAMACELIRFAYQVREFWDTSKILENAGTNWFEFGLLVPIVVKTQGWVLVY